MLAGDVSPIDVITHLPVLCEESGVPYVFVPSKEALGGAGQTKRPTSVMLVLPKPLKAGGAAAGAAAGAAGAAVVDAAAAAAAAAAYAEEHAKVLAKVAALHR